ncbi:MAG: glycosyltransferase [Clostridiales bacterium]|nr:glycosyltransferase [Clostridiales bacterium]
MKKKIMLIVPMLHQGGFERVCVATARLLEPFFDIYIIIFDSKDIAYDIKGLNVIDLHMGVKKDMAGKLLNVVKRSFMVRRLKKKLTIDIAYSFGPTANLVNVFSRRREQVWTGIRSYMDMENERKISLLCKLSDKILCCSKMIEEELAKKYNCKKAITLYNPLDVEEIRKNAEAGGPRLPWDNAEHIIVSMGREDDVKGYWHLIKSFALLQKDIPEVKLMIIGEGDFEEYRNLAKRLEIADHIFFPGMKKNPFPYLKAAEVYVLSSYNEGFPNALLEAMALGIPVIATDCMTGPREILQKKYISEGEAKAGKITGAIDADYGVLIPNMSPEKNLDAGLITEEEKVLYEEIKRMVTDRGHYEKYKKVALMRAGDFSNKAYVEILKKQIEA